MRSVILGCSTIQACVIYVPVSQILPALLYRAAKLQSWTGFLMLIISRDSNIPQSLLKSQWNALENKWILGRLGESHNLHKSIYWWKEDRGFFILGCGIFSILALLERGSKRSYKWNLLLSMVEMLIYRTCQLLWFTEVLNLAVSSKSENSPFQREVLKEIV